MIDAIAQVKAEHGDEKKTFKGFIAV